MFVQSCLLVNRLGSVVRLEATFLVFDMRELMIMVIVWCMRATAQTEEGAEVQMIPGYSECLNIYCTLFARICRTKIKSIYGKASFLQPPKPGIRQ